MKYLVTHGGLGNQLFQKFAFDCYHGGVQVNAHIQHISRYKHGFLLSDIFSEYQIHDPIIRLLLNLRVPKFARKLNLTSREFIKIRNFVVFDGYFQNPEFYSVIPKATQRDVIAHYRKFLLSSEKKVNSRYNNLIHLRLRDFFSTEREENDYIHQISDEISHFDYLITNNEQKVLDYCPQFKNKLIHTGSMSDMELLSLIAEFGEISSNSSTLAMWGAVLGRSKFIDRSGTLDEIFQAIE